LHKFYLTIQYYVKAINRFTVTSDIVTRLVVPDLDGLGDSADGGTREALQEGHLPQELGHFFTIHRLRGCSNGEQGVSAVGTARRLRLRAEEDANKKK